MARCELRGLGGAEQLWAAYALHPYLGGNFVAI